MSDVQGKTLDAQDEDASKQLLSLWRNRNFVLMWSGQMASSIGTQVSQLAFPWLILVVTGSPVQAGLIASIRILPYILFGLPAGALVDRWNSKRVMILCDVGRAIALGSIPVAFALGRLTGVQLYMVSFIEGMLFIFFGLAEAATQSRIVPKEQLSVASAQNEMVYSVSGLIGPSLSGILYAIGSALPFLADAVTYIASVIALLFLKIEIQEERTEAPRRLWIEILEGLSWLWHHPVIRFLAILTSGLDLASIGYVLIVLVLAQNQHASKLATGFIFASGGIGSIIGTFLVGPLSKRFLFGKLMVMTTWLWALTWLPFAIAPNPLALSVAMAAAFIVLPIHASLQYGYRLAQIPDQLQGRVNSVFRLILFGSQSLGFLLTGALLQAIGPVPTVLVLFIPQFILAVAATLNRHLWNAPFIGREDRE